MYFLIVVILRCRELDPGQCWKPLLSEILLGGCRSLACLMISSEPGFIWDERTLSYIFYHSVQIFLTKMLFLPLLYKLNIDSNLCVCLKSYCFHVFTCVVYICVCVCINTCLDTSVSFIASIIWASWSIFLQEVKCWVMPVTLYISRTVTLCVDKPHKDK